MNKSPKVVQVDLLQQSRKKKKSPTKSRLSRQAYQTSQVHQISFSNEKKFNSPITSQVSQHRKINKNLFCNNSPKKSPWKSQATTTAYKTDRSSCRNTRLSPEKNQSLTDGNNERLFKKSVDKIKKTFFRGVRDNRQATIKTLKAIGNNAKYRAQHRSILIEDSESLQRKRQKNIPVQFYGCDPSSTLSKYSINKFSPNRQQNISKASRLKDSTYRTAQTQASPEVEDIGTYINFEEGWKQEVMKGLALPQHVSEYHEKSRNIPSPQNIMSESILTQQEVFPDILIPQHQHRSSSGFDSINQIQIDTICQIYEMCQKYQENDKLTLHELYKLLEQFQRLYFIKVIQQSQSSKHKTSRIFESDFNLLLKGLEEAIRVIFYRKEACDIYDSLYYLKETNNLQKVCTLFLGIKNILQL